MSVAVFLDRDGTIIEDTHYVKDPDTVKLLPNAVLGLKKMREKGYLLFIVSNQSGVGRGIITSAQFKAVHRRVCDLLQAEQVDIAEFCYCFHTPDEKCHCRKPQTGNLPKQFQGESIDWARSYTVGDRESDVELGIRMGGTGCWLKADVTAFPREGEKPYLVFRDLLEMAEFLPSVHPQ